MDPLTHTLLGAAVARTPVASGLRYAGFTAIVGANIPDIDIVSLAAGSDASIAFRRGWTHGLLAMAVLPLVLSGSVVAYDRWRRLRDPGVTPVDPARILVLAYLSTLTHPLLDWLNTYGVRLLMPFSEHWYYGDALFIVDPWMWLLLGGTVFISRRQPRIEPWLLLAVLTSVGILLARGRIPTLAPLAWVVGLVGIAFLDRLRALRRNPAWVVATGLTLVLFYLVTMIASSVVVESRVLRELADRGISDVRRLMVAPRPADPFRWGFVAEVEEVYRFGTTAPVAGSAFRLDPRWIERPVSSPIVDAALAAPQVQGTLRWMRFPFVEIDSDARGHTVFLLDARYVKTRTEGFGGVVVELDLDLKPRSQLE